MEPRRGPGDSWGCTGRPRGARLQDQDAQRPCLEGSVFARGHSPLLSAFPDGRPASRRRRRVAFSSRGRERGGTLRTPSGRELRRTRSTRPRGHGWPPRSPAPSPHRPAAFSAILAARSLVCARALSLPPISAPGTVPAQVCARGTKHYLPRSDRLQNPREGVYPE